MTLERIVAELAERTERRFYGKYRGIVVDHGDPARLGRLRVRVPSLLGPDVVTGWATPCLPFGGAADQGFLFVPDVGAGVWVEFEEGDLEFPLWVGTFWTSPGADTQLPRPQTDDGSATGEVQDPPTRKIIKTAKGHTVQFEDADGAECVLVREGSQGHMVRMDRDGVTLADGRGNAVHLTKDGSKVTDVTGNSIALGDRSIRLADITGNTIRLDSSGITLDAPGNTVTISGAHIALKDG